MPTRGDRMREEIAKRRKTVQRTRYVNHNQRQEFVTEIRPVEPAAEMTPALEAEMFELIKERGNILRNGYPEWMEILKRHKLAQRTGASATLPKLNWFQRFLRWATTWRS
jgi:hypothetical protein